MSEPSTHLKETIKKSKLLDWSENGRCSMCSSGDKPAEDGRHHHKGQSFECGNQGGCTLCNGCLPPGEICAGCYRKNMYELEC